MDAADMTQDRIDKEAQETLRRARLNVGISPFRCDDCGEVIPEPRRKAFPGTRTCIVCQAEREGKI